MKILLLCEGPNELAVINLLLEHRLLKFDYSDLLDMRPFHARQLTSPQLIPALNAYADGDIDVIRIGDRLSDKIIIPSWINNIHGISKVCTLPELEILLIISEGLWSDFQKVKSKIRPKVYCKKHIKINKRFYDNSSQFYRDYFSDCMERLIFSIKEYKRLHPKQKKDEGYLADLLK